MFPRTGVGAGNRGLDVDELAAFMRNLGLDISPSEAMLVSQPRENNRSRDAHTVFRGFQSQIPGVHYLAMDQRKRQRQWRRMRHAGPRSFYDHTFFVLSPPLLLHRKILRGNPQR